VAANVELTAGVGPGAMTKTEFISKQKAIEHGLRYLWFIPWGVVFAIELGIMGWLIYLLLILLRFFSTDALPTIICEVGFCLFVLGGAFVGERMWRRKLDRSGLRCLACRKWLYPAVAETGRCVHCDERVLDP